MSVTACPGVIIDGDAVRETDGAEAVVGCVTVIVTLALFVPVEFTHVAV